MYKTANEVPVLLIAFNRPNLFKELLTKLSVIKPKKIYVAIDGPRISKPDEIDLVKETQSALELIDWPCEIFTKFETTNLGCKNAVVGAIDWVFESEEEVIILEDDIRPNFSFFEFCRELLEKYKDESKVIAVSGFNALNDGNQRPSYRFSAITHVWGWATWKSAWQKYPRNIEDSSQIPKLSELKQFFSCTIFEAYLLRRIFKNIAKQKLDTWDYQLLLLAMRDNGVCATSNVNLVENVGFGNNSTHTQHKPTYLLPSTELKFPLQHPALYRDRQADSWIIKNAYGVNFNYVMSRLKQLAVKL